jgi:hypothetical protein
MFITLFASGIITWAEMMAIYADFVTTSLSGKNLREGYTRGKYLD